MQNLRRSVHLGLNSPQHKRGVGCLSTKSYPQSNPALEQMCTDEGSGRQGSLGSVLIATPRQSCNEFARMSVGV